MKHTEQCFLAWYDESHSAHLFNIWVPHISNDTHEMRKSQTRKSKLPQKMTTQIKTNLPPSAKLNVTLPKTNLTKSKLTQTQKDNHRRRRPRRSRSSHLLPPLRPQSPRSRKRHHTRRNRRRNPSTPQLVQSTLIMGTLFLSLTIRLSPPSSESDKLERRIFK